MAIEGNTIFSKNSQEQSNQRTQESQAPTVGQGEPIPQQPSDIPSDTKRSLMKKIIIGLIVAGVVIGLGIFIFQQFFASKNEKVTLSYWGLWEDESVVKATLAEFIKENPNISVSYKRHDIKDYRDRLVARTENGNGPDIFYFHNSWVPQLSEILLPLPSGTISNADFTKKYYQVAQNDLIRSGAIYGVPAEVDTLALFVNTEMFEQSGIEIPKTWQEFTAAARDLTVKDEEGKIVTSGAAIGTFDNIDHAPDILSVIFIQNGVNLTDIAKSAKNATDALNFYTCFSMDRAPNCAKIWDNTLGSAQLAFVKGKVAMYFGYSWDIFSIRGQNPDLPFKVIPIPSLFDRKSSIASYWAYGISAKNMHQKEALQLLKYLSEEKTAKKLFLEESKVRMFGEPYPQKELASILKDNQYVYPFVQQALIAKSSFFVSGTYDNGINQKANSYLGDAVRSVLEGGSSETAVETLSSGISQLVTQYPHLSQ